MPHIVSGLNQFVEKSLCPMMFGSSSQELCVNIRDESVDEVEVGHSMLCVVGHTEIRSSAACSSAASDGASRFLTTSFSLPLPADLMSPCSVLQPNSIFRVKMDSETTFPVRDAVMAQTVNAQASAAQRAPHQAMIFAHRAFQTPKFP
jgi:hypothetical protein